MGGKVIMKHWLWLALALSISHSAFGLSTDSTTTSTLPSDEVKSSTPGINRFKDAIGDKKFDEDQRIKDLELRALAGSLNRYSLQFTMSYSGPPSNDLSNPNRPNPDNRPGDNRTYLSGSANTRLRITSDDAINFGTGVVFYEPFQAMEGKDQDRPNGRNNYGINDPRVSYDHSYAYEHTQMRSSISASATTTQAYVQAGQWGAATLAQYFKYVPGDKRLTLGLQTSVDYFAYDRQYRPTKTSAFLADNPNLSKYYVNIIPNLAYKLSDKVNFQTSVDYPYSNPRAQQSNWLNWNHPQSTWWVGFGWAITHEIYIYPYINFFLESPSFNTASANFNTTFSVF
jgi:hypothetical protein